MKTTSLTEKEINTSMGKLADALSIYQKAMATGGFGNPENKALSQEWLKVDLQTRLNILASFPVGGRPLKPFTEKQIL